MNISMTLNQSGVLAELTRFVSRAIHETPLAVVTGDTGTGKSTVLGMFARALAIRYLNDPGFPNTLAFMIPLHTIGTVSLSQPLSAEEIWQAILERWVGSINKLERGEGITHQIIDERMKIQRTVLILDSIDEFLLMNPNITSDLFRELVLIVQNRYRNGSGFAVVLGVRWGEPVLNMLQKAADCLLTVKKLDSDEAMLYFPGAKPVIEKVLASQGGAERNLTDDGVLSLLCTPLVLSELDDFARIEQGTHKVSQDVLQDEIEKRPFDQEHEIIDLALSANIKKSRIHARKFSDVGIAEVDDWKHALMIVSMIFSSIGHRGEVTESQIREQIEQTRKLWENHQWPSGMEEEQANLAKGLALIAHQETNQQLLAKTVFYPHGRFIYRFKHREWQDFLLGLYFAFAFRTLNLKELTRTSFTIKAHGYGGQILSESSFKVDRKFAEFLVGQLGNPFGHFILANLGALLAKSLIPIERDALGFLFEHHKAMPGGAKIIFVAGLGYRLLRNKALFANAANRPGSGDKSADVIYELLDAFFKHYLVEWYEMTSEEKAKAHGQERVILSLAWCYLAAFKKHLRDDLEAPPGAWPGLDLSVEQERQVINGMFTEIVNGEFLRGDNLPPVYKTGQFAVLRVQTAEYRQPHRTISLAHYLYTLSLTLKYNVAIDDVRVDLPLILREHEEIRDLFRKYDIPEVGKIYQICQKVLSVAPLS